MKKLLMVAIMVALLMGMSIPALAAQWIQDGPSQKYQLNNGNYMTDNWMGIEGKLYHFDQNGINDNCLDYEYRYDAPFDGYDPQYPLKGMLEQYGLNQVVTIKKEVDGVRISADIRTDSKYGKYNYIWTGNSNIIGEFAQALSGSFWDEQSIMNQMKQGGRNQLLNNLYNPLKVGNEAEYEETKAVLDEIRNFLNSFDFKNASDYEKAEKISPKILEASYDYDVYNQYNKEKENTSYSDVWVSQSAYGCLIKKKCVCAGYASTFQLLGRLVGLECINVNYAEPNHVWNYVKINGEWWSVSNGTLYQPGETFYAEDIPFPSFAKYHSVFQETNPNRPELWDVENGIVTNIYIGVNNYHFAL